MSVKELLKNEKYLSAVTYLLAGTLLLLFFFEYISLSFKRGFTASTVIAIALLPVLIVNFQNIKKIQAERKSGDL